MAKDPVDLHFLGEQIKRLQGDVRVLKGDGAQVRADLSRLEGDVAGVKADITRVEMRLDAFAESVDDRFEQGVELAKSNFRTLDQKIDRTRDELSAKIDRIRNEMNEKFDRLIAKVDELKR